MSVNQESLSLLKEGISFKWRVQSFSKSSPLAVCVAYIDARDVMDMLDACVGVENWQSDYREIKGNLFAGIGIKINGEWVWKWDVGTESTSDKAKGEASDSFKRASVKWGIGRFLYDIPVQYCKSNEPKKDNNYPYVIDEEGNKVKNLSDYINQRDAIRLFYKDSRVTNVVKKFSEVENKDVSTKELTEFEKQSIEKTLRSIKDPNSIRIFLSNKTKELTEQGYSNFEHYLNALLNAGLARIKAK